PFPPPRSSDLGHTPRGAKPLLAKSSNVGVVLQKHSRSQTPLDLRAHGIIGPSRKIRRLAQRPGFHVDDSGHSDAGAEETSATAILIGQSPNGVAHFRDHMI